MPSYKLTYFDLPGAAEHIRYIFAYAGQKYEDNRISFKDWPAFKPKTPFGKMPFLEVDGKVLNQSNVIARYLGKKFGLVSDDEWEAAQAEALVDTLGDLKQNLSGWFMEKDPQKKEEIVKQLNEVHFPNYLSKFEKIVAANPSGLLVGSKLTWADLTFGENLCSLNEKFPGTLKPYPALTALVEKVNKLPSIKKWIETRPKSAPLPV